MMMKTKMRKNEKAEKSAWFRRAVMCFLFSAFSFSSFSASASSVLDSLLGLRTISLFDENTTLSFVHELPAWVWVLIVLLALGFAGWSYHHLLGSRTVRMLLGTVRGLLLILMAVLICQPEIVRQDEKVEEDWLLVLIDRSASMQVRDTRPPEVSAEADSSAVSLADPRPISRDDALRRALIEQAALFTDQRLGEERKIHYLGFGEQTFEVRPPWLDGELRPADAPATALRTAIEQALREAAGHPISGIVLMTDGRSPQSTGADLVARLEQQAISVFTVPLGAITLPLDLAVTRVDAPQRAFVNDSVPVSVVIERVGGEGQAVRPGDVIVRLVDDQTGAVLDEKTLAEGQFGEPMRLKARSDVVGPVEWRVEVEHAGTIDGGELLKTNNQRTFAVEMIDRPIRVLYVEGYPRWEYRYLKNLLVREESIDSSMLLLTADRAFAQEGDTPITRMPDSPEELRPYDVMILGDVPAGFFSARQIALLKDHVSGGGAGLLWIGGQRSVPVDYAATPLADLLPMRRPGQVQRLDPALGGIDLLPTPLARELAVLELRGPEVQTGVERDLSRYAGVPADWPRGLPPLLWAQDLTPLKPTAEVLAHWPLDSVQLPIPLIARLRYGAGQSVYVATDETWRWRFGRGELYFEQFWIQIVRMLGRDRVQQTGQRARLAVAERRLAQDQTTVVEVTLEDPALIARELERITVDVFDGPDADADRIDRLELRPVTDTEADPELGGEKTRQTFRATWRATTPGRLDLRVTEGALLAFDLRQPIEVIAPDDEWRQPQADHARLAALAEQTGGAVVPLHELARLEQLVPNRARRIPDDLREPIWNSVLALIVILTLLTVEWIARKLIRLV